MDGYLFLRDRRIALIATACGLIAMVALASTTLPAQANELDGMMARAAREEATLNAITFIDANHGWAVGDHGAIWRTIDGGQTWGPQRSNVDCRLDTVCFVDEDHGWAAGGEHRPYVQSTRGVLLRTSDGGATWELEKTLLPAFKKIAFFGAAQGWALTEPSALYPLGLFHTDNMGRAWTPVANHEAALWTIADFIDPITAVAAGAGGARGAVHNRVLELWNQSEYGLREPRALRMSGAGDGWLVGDGGLLLITRDGGNSWRTPPQATPGAEQFDWRAVEVRGPRCWVAGNPGSRVWHSADAGATWQSYPTGQSLPITALTFVDDEHGWATTTLGGILATSDGGRTWRKQRGARQRAALLAIYAEAREAPLEAIARLAANEGYTTAVQLIARRDAEPDMTTAAEQRERDRAAMVSLGACAVESAWQFPVRQREIGSTSEQIVDGWNRVHEGQGVDRLEGAIVRMLRVYRPDVVFTSSAYTNEEEPLAHLINQAVLRAVTLASDKTKYPEQISIAGLEPWTVKKAFGSQGPGRLGTINVNTTQLAPRLTQSLADYCVTARGLLEERYTPAPTSWGFRSYLDSLPQGAGQQDFFSGLNVQPGGDARREMPKPASGGADVMRQVAEKHRNLQAILKHAEQSGRGRAIVLAQVGELTRGLDSATAGQALFDLAQAYYQTGEWDLAAEIFQLLTEKYPTHRLTTPALAWLVRYWSSAEAACRVRSVANPTPLEPGAGAATIAGGLVVRRAKAIEFGKQLEAVDPHAYSEMSVQSPLATARGAEPGQRVDRFFSGLTRSRPRDAWWMIGRGEEWLVEGSSTVSPKPMLVAKRAASKPRLDGQLNDDVWAGSEGVPLRAALGGDAEWPAVVMLAYDEEFLYLAIDCRRTPGVKYAGEPRVRDRDADLTPFDRVELLLDTDRDTSTFFRLVVDHRGWAAEDCWGDSTWNPKWFIAPAGDAESWRIEAAIPLAELSVDPVAAKTFWSVGAQRIVPKVGFQSWTRPATAQPLPQGFGFLMFD